jgi:hypothetical protein
VDKASLMLQRTNETICMIKKFIEERRKMVRHTTGHVRRLLNQWLPLGDSASKRRTPRPSEGPSFKELRLKQRRLTQPQLLYRYWAFYFRTGLCQSRDVFQCRVGFLQTRKSIREVWPNFEYSTNSLPTTISSVEASGEPPRERLLRA